MTWMAWMTQIAAIKSREEPAVYTLIRRHCYRLFCDHGEDDSPHRGSQGASPFGRRATPAVGSTAGGDNRRERITLRSNPRQLYRTRYLCF
uniref:Uncharacterized protein n=1 Tax=Caenorhabditis japonica TaxID=281687 RepID=A0A8R1IKF6_CAEJA